jgi:dUTP pyrophosphatase
MTKYTLYIKIDTDDEDVIMYYSNLTTNKEDSGLDLMVPEKTVCKTLDVNRIGENDNVCWTKINTKIKCYMYDNIMNRQTAYYLYPRSSIYKYGLSMANSVGIIDAGYRGNIIGIVYNNTYIDINIDKGTKLFQICAPDLSPFDIKIVDSLPDSIRGENGFGSTGK